MMRPLILAVLLSLPATATSIVTPCCSVSSRPDIPASTLQATVRQTIFTPGRLTLQLTNPAASINSISTLYFDGLSGILLYAAPAGYQAPSLEEGVFATALGATNYSLHLGAPGLGVAPGVTVSYIFEIPTSVPVVLGDWVIEFVNNNTGYALGSNGPAPEGVPEPGSWCLAIVGFFLLRRAR